jgi:hypothetical protein
MASLMLSCKSPDTPACVGAHLLRRTTSLNTNARALKQKSVYHQPYPPSRNLLLVEKGRAFRMMKLSLRRPVECLIRLAVTWLRVKLRLS